MEAQARGRMRNGEKISSRKRGESASFKMRRSNSRTKNSTPDRRRHESRRHNLEPKIPRNVLRRTVSEPILYKLGGLHCQDEGHDYPKKSKELKDFMLKQKTLSDLFHRPPSFPRLSLPPTPLSSFYEPSEKSFPEEDRILVNITVEGSTGPIRVIVRKRDTVSDLIKVTIDNYAKEGRHPVLDSDTNMFELHVSNFSMESLNRSVPVGELGTRTFFLRQEIHGVADQPVLFTSTPGPFFLSFIIARLKKIRRKTRKFWKILDCMVCG